MTREEIEQVIGKDNADEYTDLRALPDGRIIGVHRLLYHWTLLIDMDAVGYEDRYCFATYDMAKRAFDSWNGEGDPGTEWHRHPKTGRRREGGREWVAP